MKKLLLIIFNIAFSFFFFPQLYAQSDQTVTNGSSTTAVNFTAGCNYSWTNNNPSIGLPTSGIGNIPSFTAVNTSTTPITATIVATPVNSGFAYILSSIGYISVINTFTDQVISKSRTSFYPFGEAVSPDGKFIYVTDPSNNAVITLDASTYAVLNDEPIGVGPRGIAVSPDGGTIYVTNESSQTVVAVNTSTHNITWTIPVGSSPLGVAVSPDGSRLYVANQGSNTVTIINPLKGVVITSTQVGGNPNDLIVSHDGSLLYVANGLNSVSIINTATNKVVKSIKVGQNAVGIAISSDDKYIYVVNEDSQTVSVINTQNQTVTATIRLPGGQSPFSISVSPDGQKVYVVNQNGVINVINTSTNTVTNSINTVIGALSFGGSFITSGIGCSSAVVTFKITVNPNPIIIKSVAAGAINACQGTPSANPNIQQFTVSGKYLAADITVTAPAGFETSLNATSGYNTSLTLTENNGTVNNTVVYVRSSATAPAGNIAGDVVLSSTGVAGQSVPVSGTVNMVPTVNPINPQTAPNGGATIPVNFTGTASAFSWTNDTPGIGLNASGTGNIPSFIATNNTNSPIIANIKVTPLNNTNCDGIPAMFTITVYPPPAVIVASEASGSVTACMGTPSASPNIQQFTVSGKYLPKDVKVTAPTGFELSLSSAGVYGNDLILTQNIGTVNNTIIYVRSSATAPAGNITGNIVITSDGVTDRSVPVNGIINTVPIVDEVPSQKLQNGATTVPVNFTGTANTYNWVNDNVNIGLAASGTGNIPSFTVINITNRPIIAAITVTPLNSTNCDGNPVRFTIMAEPTATGLLTIPNTFTPNGDGRNDSWVIENFEYYPGSTISIFNRWGQKLFSSIGYPIPWDGTYQGKALPSGTYYYIIDLKNREPVITGWVAIIR